MLSRMDMAVTLGKRLKWRGTAESRSPSILMAGKCLSSPTTPGRDLIFAADSMLRIVTAPVSNYLNKSIGQI
ncbi:MAG: hypothetical protein JO313_03875 [Verrucomicrobia bacterium]|nr:hypothetical protein [Verrucomicrobiota bacterium]